MKLPAGITFEQTLLGSGHGTTVRGLENGQPVIVKSIDTSTDLFAEELFDEDSTTEDNEDIKKFESEKERELQAAGKSKYFLEGRLEKEDGNVFWVRPYMHRSLYEKVAFKESPDSVELVGICLGIVKALDALEQLDGSGHGNLSLGNVLIQDKDVRDLKLVDLLVADKKHSRTDKRALGLIIYQLVNGELVELADKIASVPDDQDWKILGSTEQMWRDFCSELLNPYGKYAESDWNQIEQALKKIEAAYSKRKKLRLTLIVSAFVAFGAVVFLIWKIKFQEEEIVVDLDTIQGQWLELLNNYFSWGDNYLKSKSDFREASTEEAFMEMFYDNKKARLPMKIIGRVTGQGARLQTAPGQVYEIAQKIDVLLLDNSKQQQIVLAHKFVMELRGKIEDWEVLEELSEANKNFTDSGFGFGVSETQRLLDSISFEDGSLTLSLLYSLKKSVESLSELQDLYARFEAQVAELDGRTESAFLPLYATYLRQQLTEPSEEPVSYLRSLVDSSAEVLSYWEAEKSGIAEELFAESELELVSEPSFSVSEKHLRTWKKMVADFRIIEIPLLDSSREEFIASRENILELNQQINELQEPGASPAKFDQEYEALFEGYQNDVNAPLIESNRTIIESAIKKNLLALKSLIEKTEDRWAEVNPDIGERLMQLSQVPKNLLPVLASAWQTYLDREVNVRTEESFSGPREFIVFQRGYFAKLKNFEYFQNTQLSQLGSDWTESAVKDMRQDLLTGLRQNRRAFYDEMVDEWVDQVVPFLFDLADKLPIEKPTEGFLQRMETYESQLLDYARLLNSALNGFDKWELPEEGITNLWNALNEGNARQQWTQSESFATYANQVKVFFELSRASGPDALLTFILKPENPAFARSTALGRISKIRVLSPDELGQIAEVVPGLSEQVPDAELDDYEALLKSLWIQVFKNDALEETVRRTVFSYNDAMGVRAVDLSGRTRFLFEIYSALADLGRNEELYLKDPSLLKGFIADMSSLPVDAQEPELEGILDALRGIDLAEVKETFENAPFIAKGWVVKKESKDQLTLAWQDYELVFNLIEYEDGNFLVAELETSIGLFNDWMTQKRLWDKGAENLPREWEVFISQPYNPIDDYRQGMKLWSIARRGLKRDGLTPSSKWFEVDTVVADEYTRVEGELFPASSIDKTMPLQQTGARLSRFFAESMGMSLMTPAQWRLVVEGHSAEDAFLWQTRLDEALSKALADEVRSGSYYFDRKIEESGHGADRSEVLVKVDEQSEGRFKHLAGNVAEYLYDPERDIYYVTGGSSFSATLATWRDEHMVPKRSELTAFSDVGVRLALLAPEESAYIQFFNVFNDVLKR